MTILYHITPSNNLPSIMKNGLIPAFKKGLYCGDAATRKPFVWLTDNPEHILSTQAGKEWIEKHSPIVLSVDCSGINVEQYVSCITGGTATHEYYVEHTIKQHFGVEE